MRAMSLGPAKLATTLLLLAFLPAAFAEILLQACPEEVARARETLATIFVQWPLRPSVDPVTRDLQAITSELASRAGEQQHRQWRTHVLRDSKFNAFSIGDGHIFVTEGILRFIDSEAELAALLSHEFAHHIAGHFCQARRKPRLLTQFLGGGQQRHQVGTLSASVDPEKEREADRIGAVILERGGFNPRHAVLLAARMSTTGTPTHFQYGQRIEAMQNFLANRPGANWSAKNSAAFIDMKENLRLEQVSP